MSVSFEFFPPRSHAGQLALATASKQLQSWQPDFVSMTYGAGGTTQDVSFAGCDSLVKQGYATAAHLTCVGAAREKVTAAAKQFTQLGVDHFVALRGDSPEQDKSPGGSYQPHPKGYAFANDLVAGLREWFDGTISVAAYPEVHPQAVSAGKDLDFLRAKLDAGADQMITQYCYDTDALLRFAERLQQAGIEQRLIVGVMPIHDIAAVKRFSAACGASVPAAIEQRFDGYTQTADLHRVAVDIAVEQCQKLAQNGIPDVHFYTLNRAELTASVLANLDQQPVELANIA